MTLSTGAPAGTIIRMRRGRSSTAISSSGASHGRDRRPSAGPSTNAFVLAAIEIVAGDRKPPARDVAREVRAHHAEADYADLVGHQFSVPKAS